MPNFVVCGTTYPYPNVGDNPWGTPHIDWASAVSSCLSALETQVQTLTLPNVFTAVGDMVYANPAIVPTRLPIGSIGSVMTVSPAGVPAWLSLPSGVASIPIGGTIAWNDFNGILTLDPNFRMCDGSVINAPSSLIDGQTTDDLSGCAIVGYGTLGAGDIGTAPYDATPTGNPDNQINLIHSHTHAHTHPGPSHTHGPGSLTFRTGRAGVAGGTFGAGFFAMFLSTGAQVTVGNFIHSQDFLPGGDAVWEFRPDVNGDVDTYLYTDNSGQSGVTASGGSSNTGAASTSTTSQSLSSTQSIQPRSQRYRMIVRVL